MEGSDSQEEGAGNGNNQCIERQEKGEDARDIVMMDARSERICRSDRPAQGEVIESSEEEGVDGESYMEVEHLHGNFHIEYRC